MRFHKTLSSLSYFASLKESNLIPFLLLSAQEFICIGATLLFLSLLPATGQAQWQPDDSWPAFPANEVAVVRIEIDQDSLDLILFEDSLFSNHEYPATFIFESSAMSDTVYNVGFRLRGNTSRMAEKKSFKVSFNTFEQGREWQGLQKLNLNGEHNDPSIMRARLCWEMAEQFGVTSTQTAHVRLYINGVYKGLYLNVEHIDDTFLERQFGSDAGNLYKCHWSANLSWQGSDESNYQQSPFGSRTYELKTNVFSDDYSSLVEFISTLNNTPLSDLKCELEQLLDVPAYLKAAAFEVMIGHWDGYIWNNNNYYLYHRPSDRRFQFIEYDLDNTLGIDWVGGNWTDYSVYNFNNGERPLYTRLLNIAEYRDLFSAHIEAFTNLFQIADIEARAQEIQNLCIDAALEDSYRSLDYQFDDDDYINALFEAAGGHVDYGIIPYFEARFTNAIEQLESFESTLTAVVNDNTPLNNFQLRWEVEVSENVESVNALIIINDNISATIPLSDDGLGEDLLAGDQIWTGATQLDYQLEGIHYQIEYTGAGNTMLTPCDPQWVWITPSSLPLVINEVMASNQGWNNDQMGDYDDWFEVFNGQSTGVSTDQLWFTDNLRYPQKFRIRNEVISGNSHLLIWTDDEGEEGVNHANFRLNSSGEEVNIVTIDQDALRLIDHTSFGPQNLDISFGRITDGAPNFVFFNLPTPNAANGVVSVVNIDDTDKVPYPNPTRGIIALPWRSSWNIFNLQGQLVLTMDKASHIDVSELQNGCYLLVADDKKFRIVKY